ncbi:MAG: hypothetical protein DSZ28_06770 [Thiothrix sp.]|nr:MAG: hypothetical protein DSZ28_06770 [Thiothrix sp.]
MSVETVSELMKFYFTQRVLAEKTQRQYESVVRVLVRDTSDQIDCLDEATLLAWRGQVIDRASSATFNNYLRHLRAIFSYGLKHQQVANNPFSVLEGSPVIHRKPKVISQSQYNRLMDYVKHSGEFEPTWFWAAVIEFMATTGVRGRQLIALKWQDLDFEEAAIRLCAEGSKTRREWIIPLPDAIGGALIKWKLRLGIHKTPALLNTQVFNVTLYHDKYIGRKMTVTQLNDFYSRLSKKIGFSVGSRVLRHSLANHLANYNDVGEGYLFALKDLLGHRDIRTTQIYVSGNIGRIRKMMNDSGISSNRRSKNKPS